jgi:hypothetical protein
MSPLCRMSSHSSRVGPSLNREPFMQCCMSDSSTFSLTVTCHTDELWAINSLTLSPGRVLMCDRYPYTAERLEQRALEVLRIPYDEIQKTLAGFTAPQWSSFATTSEAVSIRGATQILECPRLVRAGRVGAGTRPARPAPVSPY